MDRRRAGYFILSPLRIHTFSTLKARIPLMNLQLNGKTAFVAGASAGLGYAVAEALLAEGCRVAICSRNAERIEAAAERLRAAAPGGEALPLVCDVADEEAIEAAVQRTLEAFGRLHILVTNAGGPPSGAVAEHASEAWRRAFELNLLGTVNLCRSALPALAEAAAVDGHARILMITSVSAKQPIPGLVLSNALRAGVQGFAKTLADEVGPLGITVNTLLPGYTRTDRLTDLREGAAAKTGKTAEEVEGAWAEATALRRIAEPHEFAAAAAFLASGRASYITGIALPVDGGRSKHVL